MGDLFERDRVGYSPKGLVARDVPNPQWEYTTAMGQERMNELGAEGWRVVTAERYALTNIWGGYDWRALMERRV